MVYTSSRSDTPRVPAGLLVAGVLAAVLAVVLAENLGANLLYEILLRLPGIDKAMHWVQYLAIFGALWWGAGFLRVGPWQRIAIAAACGMGVGIVDELVQRTLARRTFELADLAVDAAALVAGAGIAAPWASHRLSAAVVAVSLATTGVIGYGTYRELVHYNRALLFERQHDLKGAREEYRKALASGHRSPGLYNSLAWAEVESGVGDANAAVQFAEAALAGRPGDADTLDTYGWALHHAGRSPEALQALERARTLKPAIYCVDYHLGVVLAALGRACDARRHFERQIASFPKADESRRAARALVSLACPA